MASLPKKFDEVPYSLEIIRGRTSAINNKLDNVSSAPDYSDDIGEIKEKVSSIENKVEYVYNHTD
jgi:tetrahydromethanopterin S-methyltransferase subunit G